MEEIIKETELFEMKEEDQMKIKRCAEDYLSKRWDLVNDKQWSKAYDHFDDNTTGLSIRKTERKKAKALGIVIYGESKMYDTFSTEENMTRHIWVHGSDYVYEKNWFMDQVKTVLWALFIHDYGRNVQQIIVGHEHGEKTGKCHLQIIVSLYNEIDTKCPPGNFKLFQKPSADSAFGKFEEPLKLLYLTQRAVNSRALSNYCKKDGDFSFFYPDKAIKIVRKLNSKGEELKTVNPWATIMANPDLSLEDKLDLVKTHAPRDACTNMKNIEYSLNSFTTLKIPECEFRFPEHLMENPAVDLIREWYFDYCLPQNIRRKALFILGERGCGKTEFAKSLVNHEAYYVIFSGCFNADSLKGKIPKLVILDDMTHYDDKNKEAWKHLCVGQTTNIRDCYQNIHWPYQVPCIILSNDEKMFKNMILDKEFGTQICYIDFEEGMYIGPPGTQPAKIKKMEQQLTKRMKIAVMEKMHQREAFIEKAKNNPDNIEYLNKKTYRNKDNLKVHKEVDRVSKIASIFHDTAAIIDHEPEIKDLKEKNFDLTEKNGELEKMVRNTEDSFNNLSQILTKKNRQLDEEMRRVKAEKEHSAALVQRISDLEHMVRQEKDELIIYKMRQQEKADTETKLMNLIFK